MKLSKKVAIITGASSGIGKAIAIEYAKEGAMVVLADVSDEPREGGEKTEDIIRSSGGAVISIPTDISEWNDVDTLVTKTVAEFGRLDIIVNNAAICPDLPLVETSQEVWDRTMAVNLRGVFFGCKRAVQQMLTQEIRNEARGRIVNISSQHGMVCAPNNIAYGVSKSGTVYMTRQIAADYAKDYIVCNAVAPGKILTGKSGAAADDGILDNAKARTPMPRLGAPEDVARAAVYLGSDESTYMTGVNLMVDGGWMAR